MLLVQRIVAQISDPSFCSTHPSSANTDSVHAQECVKDERIRKDAHTKICFMVVQKLSTPLPHALSPS